LGVHEIRRSSDRGWAYSTLKKRGVKPGDALDRGGLARGNSTRKRVRGDEIEHMNPGDEELLKDLEF